MGSPTLEREISSGGIYFGGFDKRESFQKIVTDMMIYHMIIMP